MPLNGQAPCAIIRPSRPWRIARKAQRPMSSFQAQSTTANAIAPQSEAAVPGPDFSDIAVVVPAYNEEATVGNVVRDCATALPGAAIIVVSDGSADATADRARAAGAEVLDLPCNLGVGGAVQAGLKRALERGFDRVARMDADGQHLAGEIPAMLRLMDQSGADFTSGSRFLPTSEFPVGSTAARRAGNKILARFLSLICRTTITDPTTGLWCLHGGLLRYFAHSYPSEYPEPEAMALLRRQGYVMVEAPVRVMPRQAGRSHVRPVGMLYFAFRVGLALMADRVRPVERRFAARSRPAAPATAGR